jgi:putative heme-binding domain-containing protein
MRPAFLAVVALALPATAAAQHIAPTDPKSPADERAGFTVPPGFEVQLVAAEPDIDKPIQMAFDAKGRLWVTTSRLYPFPAPVGEGTDKLFILSDFGPDGKARKVQVFADNLNIPIGVLPLPDCNSCLVSSAGVIYKLTDTKGTGKADKREVLFEGFGHKDTHGMVNSFTLMPDGWVYACHGFSNNSKVKGKDGHEIDVHSGNTLRFRPDGSRIEVFTRGQVNPFGMAVDPWFNLYTADCHSKPITQLIPGAVYSSFGKPHDGLGFGPDMLNHDHGSTALCGLTYYDADHFPAKYRHTMFLGNVVTNRINFDHIEWVGSTPKAVQHPDFLTSKDPWFRPTDIKLGPDGALYVADFYNKIIGHYEVDLKHPQRDKDRGRVWRIVWRGEPGVSTPGFPPKMPFTDLTKENITPLVKLLGHPNSTVRLLATNEALRRGPFKGEHERPDTESKRELALRTGGVGWVGYSYGQIKAPALAHVVKSHGLPDQFGKEGAELVAVHAVKVLAAAASLQPPERAALLGALADTPRIARAAAEALAAHPHADNVRPLIDLIKKCPPEDTHLRHALRIALRNSLRDPLAWHPDMYPPKMSAEDGAILLDVSFGLAARTPTEYNPAEFMAKMLKAKRVPPDRVAAVAEYIGRHEAFFIPLKTVIDYLQEAKGEHQRTVLAAFVRGLQAGGHKLGIEDAGQLFKLASADLRDATPATRVATLKMVGDLATVLPESVAGSPGLQEMTAAVSKLLNDAKNSDNVRAAAFDALLRLMPDERITTAIGVIDTPLMTPALLEKAALILAGSKDRNHKLAAKDALKSVPYRSAVPVAAALADSMTGGTVLLDAVRKGIAPARILQEKQVLDRLRASRVPNLDAELAELTKNLPPADQKLADLIKQRSKTFAAAKPDRELGAKLFVKHCGACHQVGGMGGKVGPQLDGIGVRGLERLLEDTLDPNRNVDAAFRARVLTLADGRSLTGLMQRVDGEVLVFADTEGKEVRIPLKDIEKNRETTLSPMPANFGETIPEADFRHLMGYLLGLREKKKE